MVLFQLWWSGCAGDKPSGDVDTDTDADSDTDTDADTPPRPTSVGP
jgi:hypothetical protein